MTYGNLGNPDVWRSIGGAVRDILVGAALCGFKFWMDYLERRQEAHEKECHAKSADVPPGDVPHARGAAAGQGNGLDKQHDADSGSGHRVRKP